MNRRTKTPKLPPFLAIPVGTFDPHSRRVKKNRQCAVQTVPKNFRLKAGKGRELFREISAGAKAPSSLPLLHVKQAANVSFGRLCARRASSASMKIRVNRKLLLRVARKSFAPSINAWEEREFRAISNLAELILQLAFVL